MTSSKSKFHHEPFRHLIVVPLRLKSTRLNRKILTPIGDLLLCDRVLQSALKVQRLVSGVGVVAAVDSKETEAHLKNTFENRVMVVCTNPKLRSGSDRVYAAYRTLLKHRLVESSKLRCVLNLQGDTPFFDPHAIAILLKKFSKIRLGEKCMWTLVEPWPSNLDPNHPSHVKAIIGKHQQALYFSRFPIPCSRKLELKALRFHIGVYAYTPEALKAFCTAETPPIETLESLEQLRALHIQLPFYAQTIKPRSSFSFRGIDTEEDVDWARQFLLKKKGL